MAELIDFDQVQANQERHQAFQSERVISPDQLPKDTLYEEYTSIIPPSEYGEISLTSAFGTFMGNYRRTLEEGSNASFIAENVNGDYSGIFRAKGNNETLKTEQDRRIANQHSPEYTSDVQAKLEAFAETVKSSDQPDAYKAEYLRTIERAKLPFVELTKHVITPEFTRVHKSPEEWAQLVDVERSVQEGEVILRYEDIARETLELAKSTRETKGGAQVTASQALSFWNLSPSEAEHIGVDDIGEGDVDLEPEKGAKLIEVLLQRMGENNWKVEIDENSAAMTVQARAEKVKFPSKRRLKGMDIAWVPSHELFHAVRGMNGKRQGLTLLQPGVNDYLATEEGGGQVCEMVAGQQFGDERQAKMAARYYGAGMMLKADERDGQIVPRYTPQEVYDQLIGYGVSATDASEIIWRNQRGTSLLHQGLSLPVETAEGVKQLPVAECYTKDTVYFEGQMEVFNWLKSVMPIAEGQRGNVTIDSRDFSDDTLRRVGYAAKKAENPGRKFTLSELRQDYNNFVSLGREQLLNIVNVLARGKMRLDFLTTDAQRWDGLIANSGLVDYQSIFTPRTEGL